MAAFPVKFKVASEITNDYANYVTSINPNIKVTEDENGDWNIKATVIGGVVAGLYQQGYNIQQFVFVQNQTGVQLDIQASSYALAPRIGATVATGYCKIKNTSPPQPSFEPFIIPKNTQLTFGNLLYVISQTTMVNSVNTTIPIQSSTASTGNALPVNTTLIAQTNIIGFPVEFNNQFVIAAPMVDGTNGETDSALQARILEFNQLPKVGGNVTDFQNWVLLSNAANVTGSYALTANELGLSVIILFILSGSSNFEYLLQTPNPSPFVPFSRQTFDPALLQVYNYIQVNKPYNAVAQIESVDTLIINEHFSFNFTNIRLSNNYTLETIISPYSFNIAGLIKISLRRAILSTPYGGTKYNNINYIILNDIINSINNDLSSISGNYAKVLVSFDLNFNSLSTDIAITANYLGYPSGQINPNQIIYDLNPLKNINGLD